MEEGIIGSEGEKVLIKLLNEKGKFNKDFSTNLNAKLAISINKIDTALKGLTGNKTDVVILGEKEVGLSLKSIKPGRPDVHLDRRWLEKDGRLCPAWQKTLHMPKKINDAIWRGILNKAKNSKADLIFSEDQEMIREFLFSKIDDFLYQVFKRGNTEPNLLLFAVYEYRKDKSITIFKIDDIIRLVRNDVIKSGISFGKNIRLGNFVWIQRKAGNGIHIDERLEKTDPNHPGNQIQTKVLPLALRDYAIKHISYFTLDINSSILS